MTQALTFPSVYAVGSIDAYIQAVRQIPRLTEKQEFDLATRLRNENDLDAARQLVLSHLRLVISVSRGYLGYGIPHADLIQEGSIGLMKAVKRFEPARGVRLVSFAVHWIKAEIHEYILKNWRMVKLATTKAQRKLFVNLRSMKVNRSGVGAQEAASIAQRLNVKPAEVAEMDTRLSGGLGRFLWNGQERGEGRGGQMSELSSNKIGHGDEVLDAAIAACASSGLLKRSIHRFDTAIVLAGVKTVEDARKMLADRPAEALERFESAAAGPTEPALEQGLGLVRC